MLWIQFIFILAFWLDELTMPRCRCPFFLKTLIILIFEFWALYLHFSSSVPKHITLENSKDKIPIKKMNPFDFMNKCVDLYLAFLYYMKMIKSLPEILCMISSLILALLEIDPANFISFLIFSLLSLMITLKIYKFIGRKKYSAMEKLFLFPVFYKFCELLLSLEYMSFRYYIIIDMFFPWIFTILKMWLYVVIIDFILSIIIYFCLKYNWNFMGYNFSYFFSNFEKNILETMKEVMCTLEEAGIYELTQHQLSEIVSKYYFSFFKNCIQSICENNILKYSNIFTSIKYEESMEPIVRLSPYFPINVINQDSGTTGIIWIHSSMKIVDLIYQIENYFSEIQESIQIIKTESYNLRSYRLQNLYIFELEGLVENCKIICNPVHSLMRGGAPEQKRKNSQKEEPRRSKRQKTYKGSYTEDSFFEIEEEEVPKMEQNESLESRPEFPFFPILNYGNICVRRENFPHLNEDQWLTFQTILYWTYLEENISSEDQRRYGRYVGSKSTQTHFFKNKDCPEGFLHKILKEYEAGTLTLNHFLKDIRFNSSHMPEDYRHLSYTLLTFLNNNSVTCLIEIFNNIISEIRQTNPEVLKKINIDDNFDLNVVVDGFHSMRSALQRLNARDAPKRHKSDIINNVLTSFLLENSSAKYKTQEHLRRILGTTKYYIKRALETVDAFENHEINTFDRFYEKRKVFDPLVFELIKKYYQQETIPAHGNQVAKNRKTGEDIPIRYLPCTVQQFYDQFCQHPDFGGKCRRRNDPNTEKWPSLALFMRNRPVHIKLMKKHGSGYCSICMQFEAYLKTYYQILNLFCECNPNYCENYEHDPGCEFVFQKFCKSCDGCNCTKCEKLRADCNLHNLKGNFSQFVENMICEKHNINGRVFGSLECMKNSCKTCKTPFFEKSSMDKFCPTAHDNIDVPKEITTKMWKKMNIVTNVEKKKGFKAKALHDVDLSIEEFFQIFHTFLTKKYGFFWHYHVRHYQRGCYNTMISNMVNGVYGDEVSVFLFDHADAWPMMLNEKMSGSQFFKKVLCQIMGVIQFSWTIKGGFDSCTNYVFAGYNVKKKAEYAILYLKKFIKEQLETNPRLKYVHCWSDGSTKEFLNRNMFGNMKSQIPEGITIIWHFFANNHGKNLCDSEFAVLKTKLFRAVGSTVEGFLRVHEVFDYCQQFLVSAVWKRKGYLLKRRRFFHQIDPILEFNQDYKPVSDVKLNRCVMWHSNGNFFRRFNSCTCTLCCKPEGNIEVCKKFQDIAGKWILTETIPATKSNSDQIITDVDEEMDLTDDDNNFDHEVQTDSDESKYSESDEDSDYQPSFIETIIPTEVDIDDNSEDSSWNPEDFYDDSDEDYAIMIIESAI